jgi:hypothetical protein
MTEISEPDICKLCGITKDMNGDPEFDDLDCEHEWVESELIPCGDHFHVVPKLMKDRTLFPDWTKVH